MRLIPVHDPGGQKTRLQKKERDRKMHESRMKDKKTHWFRLPVFVMRVYLK